MNNSERNTLHVHYSPTARYSLGYKAEYWRDQEIAIQALQANYLVKRWNALDAQANLYVKSGLGLAYSDDAAFDHEVAPAFFTGIAADWENRRFFTSYENRYTDTGKIADFFTQSARIGIAPYIGDYGDVHTWLMLEVDHRPESDESITLTPMLRFFKGSHLVELGVSDEGDALFNWVVRY